MKALPVSRSLSKSEGDAGLTLACPAPRFSVSSSSANMKFTLDSSLVFYAVTSNFDMIACSASWIVSVFTQLAKSSSSMAQSLLSEVSIFGLEGNAIWGFEGERSTIEEGELGAVCMEEVTSSELLPTIP
jgi:hypothetical protein